MHSEQSQICMRCMNCGTDLHESYGPMREKYRNEQFTILGIRHFACDSCGEVELLPADADELSAKLAEKYAKAHDLLSPSEIRSLRNALGLTQAEFGELLGVSLQTCSRWETGAAQQSKTADNLMRVLRDPPDSIEILCRAGRSEGGYTGELIQFMPKRKDLAVTSPRFEELMEG